MTFETWLLGNVVIPDAYVRTVNALRSGSEARGLAGDVKRVVRSCPRRTFLRWYALDSTYDDLVTGGADARERLIASLAATSERRLFGGRIAREEAEPIIKATVERF